jgi:hypothetical protein
MKYLILYKSNNIDNPIINKYTVTENNTTLIDASDISAAKKILKKSLNKNNINQEFEIIDLITSEKKYYIVKKKLN